MANGTYVTLGCALLTLILVFGVGLRSMECGYRDVKS